MRKKAFHTPLAKSTLQCLDVKLTAVVFGMNTSAVFDYATVCTVAVTAEAMVNVALIAAAVNSTSLTSAWRLARTANEGAPRL